MESFLEYCYMFGVFVDMIGDCSFEFYYEVNLMVYVCDFIRSIWIMVCCLCVCEFIFCVCYEVCDDYLLLN